MTASAPPPVYSPAPSGATASVPDDDDVGVDGAPAPSTGFQLVLRTGYSIPMGSATGVTGDDLSRSVGGQVPLIADIGFKPTRNLFIGGYIGLGFGGVGDAIGNSPACKTSGVSCVSADFRIGLELHYQFTPERSTNPWIGYGIGLDSVGYGASGNGVDTTVAIAGFDFAHLMGGVDFRVSKTFGLGPMVDLSIGQYSHGTTKVNGVETDFDVQNTATHEWLMLGVRGVFFP